MRRPGGTVALAFATLPDTLPRVPTKNSTAPYNVNAGAGIVSTVVDLAHFDIALSAGELLADSTLAQAMTPARSTTTGEALPYGMGWFVQEIEGEKVVWHYGWQLGLSRGCGCGSRSVA